MGSQVNVSAFLDLEAAHGIDPSRHFRIITRSSVAGIPQDSRGQSVSEHVYSCSGDIGDLIYALPTIKALGGGRLHLYPSPMTNQPMTRERAASLAPLLELQPYLTGVDWGETPQGTNLDAWRVQYKGHLNIADMIADAFGVPHTPREEPWLFVPEVKRRARVVIHRSSRYHNWNFPWRRVWEKYRHVAVMVGYPEEHRDFCQYVGPISYEYTPDFLELAKVIAGGDLFVGNQSSPMAVAIGLCVPFVQEVYLPVANCHFGRSATIYGRDGDVPLPGLEDLPMRVSPSASQLRP